MKNLLIKIRTYWVPLIWALCLIATSVCAFKTADVFYIVTAVVNMGLGIFAIIKFAKEWARKENEVFYNNKKEN